MADVMKQRRAIPKGVDEKGLVIRAHGDDQIRGVQELRRHPALAVGGIYPSLYDGGPSVWMHFLRDAHCPPTSSPGWVSVE